MGLEQLFPHLLLGIVFEFQLLFSFLTKIISPSLNFSLILFFDKAHLILFEYISPNIFFSINLNFMKELLTSKISA